MKRMNRNETMAQINSCEHYRNFFQLPELG